MKKIIILFALLVLPTTIFAASFDLIVNDANKILVKPEDLGENVSIPFTVEGSASELSQIKMMVLFVKDTRAGKNDFHPQAGDYKPEATDYEDGSISGTLVWDTQSDSAQGYHPIQVYLCSTTNKNACIREDNPEIVGVLSALESVYVGESLPGGDEPGPGEEPEEPAVRWRLLPQEGRFSSVWDVLIRVVNILLIFAGIVAMMAIIIGGYQYTTSSGIPDKAQVAKATLTYAIIGLILVMIAFLGIRYILNTLGVDTGVIWF